MVLGTGDTPIPRQISSRGPWAAPIPPWLGLGVKGHPHTPTDFLPRPVGGCDTSLGCSWRLGAPLYHDEVSSGARGLTRYLLELFPGSRGTPIAAPPHCQIAYTYTRRSHNARLNLISPRPSQAATYHRLVAPLNTPCGHPSCGDSTHSRPIELFPAAYGQHR